MILAKKKTGMWQRTTRGTMPMLETSIPRRSERLMAKVSIPGRCHDPVRSSRSAWQWMDSDDFDSSLSILSLSGFLFRRLTSP